MNSTISLRRRSPSNMLFRGEASTFVEALHLFQLQFELEASFSSGNQEVDAMRSQTAIDMREKAAEARRIYTKHQRAAARYAAAEMRQQNDETMNWLAEALEKNRFDLLAV